MPRMTFNRAKRDFRQIREMLRMRPVQRHIAAKIEFQAFAQFRACDQRLEVQFMPRKQFVRPSDDQTASRVSKGFHEIERY